MSIVKSDPNYQFQLPIILSGYHDPAAQAVMLRQWREVLGQFVTFLAVAGVLTLVVFLGVLGYEYGD
ncbi:MAG: hypothetical protein ACYC69_06750 [Thermodesulfovibrionales bacterium]